MNFISEEFLKFFILILGLFYLFPRGWRWILLLGASYYFYGSWSFSYLFLIILTTVVSYISALLIEKTEFKKLFLILPLGVNLGILFVFKYFNFFAGFTGIELNFLLPVGISFYTFQTIGYLIDVYLGDCKAEKNLGKFALFVSFFPQLIAGPIEKAKDLIPQFSQKTKFEYQNIVDGSRMILFGLFKKLVIADRLAGIVDVVYGNVNGYSGGILILATYLFAIQIYCDFSAYADIAVGIGKMMGFNLSDNFNRPYFAKSIRDFWRRWHITLYNWFRDYVYIPLGGNRRGLVRTILNIFVVFLLTGLWHGAAWNFVFWGLIHAFYLVTGILISRKFGGLIKKSNCFIDAMKIFLTFNLVSFSWIFFRAESLNDAWYVVTHLFDSQLYNGPTNWVFWSALGGGRGELYGGIVFTILLIGISLFQQDIVRFSKFMRKQKYYYRWGISYLLVMLIIFFAKNDVQQFIYFQF